MPMFKFSYSELLKLKQHKIIAQFLVASCLEFLTLFKGSSAFSLNVLKQVSYYK